MLDNPLIEIPIDQWNIFQCVQLVDSEGLNLLDLLQKKIDPHQVCSVIDVCPSNILVKKVSSPLNGKEEIVVNEC